MIVRIWHGRTKTEHADEYLEFVHRTGISDYKSIKGNLGAQVWRKIENEITHFWTISWWNDYESIKAFAGADMGKAKYYEEDKNYLLEFEPHVVHYEAFD